MAEHERGVVGRQDDPADQEIRVRLRDARSHHCTPGIVQWARENGLDLRKFVREGYTRAEVAHIDDGRVETVFIRVEERMNGLKER